MGKARKTPKKTPKKVPITWRALVQRLNRALAKDQRLIRARRKPAGWFLIDTEKGEVITQFDDRAVLEMATKLGSLKPWEEVQS